MSPTDKPQWRDSRVLVFASHLVRDNFLVQPSVTQKEAAGNASGPSLGGVPKEEKDTATTLLGCA